MTLPAILSIREADKDEPVSRTEIAAVVAFLDNALPSRQPINAKALLSAFCIALDGITKGELRDGFQSVLQNGLGHGFMPSPPELRGACRTPGAEWIRKVRQLRVDAPPLVPAAQEVEEPEPLPEPPPARPHLSPIERHIWKRYRAGGEAAIPEIVGGHAWWAELRPKFERLVELEASHGPR